MSVSRTVSSSLEAGNNATDVAPLPLSQSHTQGWNLLRGVLNAVIAAVAYCLFIVLFSSLFLLIAAMEAGTDLSSSVGSFSAMLIVLSQGVGVKTPDFQLTIVPLGLTMLSIGVLRSVIRHRQTSFAGHVATVITWSVIFGSLAFSIRAHLTDSWWSVMLKLLCVSGAAWALSCDRTSDEYRYCAQIFQRLLSSRIQRTVLIGLTLARRIFITFLVVSCVTLIVWIILGFPAVGTVFEMTRMGIGSRIITTVLTFGWLPNILIWAWSWLLGAGFTLGTLGTFTLWIGESTNLPPIPVFAIFPSAVINDTARMTILVLPSVIVAILALYTLYNKVGFKQTLKEPRFSSLIDVLYYIGSLIIATITSIIFAGILFTVCNGSLGTKNLKHIGVSSLQSLSAFGKPLQWGFAATIFVLLFIWLARVILHLLRKRNHYEMSENTVEVASRSISTSQSAGDDSAFDNAAIDEAEAEVSNSQFFTQQPTQKSED